MAFGDKTNEREGTRAVLSGTRTSAYKIRPVLNLIRNKAVGDAREILQFCERDAANLVIKLLDSAVANAEHNDGLEGSELFVSACFADESQTFKSFKPRARGRAGHIRKRSAHITLIVSQLPEERLVVVKAKAERNEANRRARRVAGSQGRAARTGKPEAITADDVVEEPTATDDVVADAAPVEVVAETTADDVVADAETEATPETDAAPEVDDTTEAAAPKASENEDDK